MRVATHPDFQGLGYGSRALQLLLRYYQGEVPCLNEADSSPTDPTQDIPVRGGGGGVGWGGLKRVRSVFTKLVLRQPNGCTVLNYHTAAATAVAASPPSPAGAAGRRP